MDSKKKSLMDLTERETKEFEKMAVILNAKHDALSRLNTPLVQQVLIEELEELRRIQAIEKERASVLKELSLSGSDLNNVLLLGKKFGANEAKTFMPIHSALKKAFTRVVSLNGISRSLLQHSLAFIRQNISILTDGGNRKLVDRKA